MGSRLSEHTRRVRKDMIKLMKMFPPDALPDVLPFSPCDRLSIVHLLPSAPVPAGHGFVPREALKG